MLLRLISTPFSRAGYQPQNGGAAFPPATLSFHDYNFPDDQKASLFVTKRLIQLLQIAITHHKDTSVKPFQFWFDSCQYQAVSCGFEIVEPKENSIDAAVQPAGPCQDHAFVRRIDILLALVGPKRNLSASSPHLTSLVQIIARIVRALSRCIERLNQHTGTTPKKGATPRPGDLSAQSTTNGDHRMTQLELQWHTFLQKEVAKLKLQTGNSLYVLSDEDLARITSDFEKKSVEMALTASTESTRTNTSNPSSPPHTGCGDESVADSCSGANSPKRKRPRKLPIGRVLSADLASKNALVVIGLRRRLVSVPSHLWLGYAEAIVNAEWNRSKAGQTKQEVGQLKAKLPQICRQFLDLLCHAQPVTYARDIGIGIRDILERLLDQQANFLRDYSKASTASASLVGASLHGSVCATAPTNFTALRSGILHNLRHYVELFSYFAKCDFNDVSCTDVSHVGRRMRSVSDGTTRGGGGGSKDDAVIENVRTAPVTTHAVWSVLEDFLARISSISQPSVSSPSVDEQKPPTTTVQGDKAPEPWKDALTEALEALLPSLECFVILFFELQPDRLFEVCQKWSMVVNEIVRQRPSFGVLFISKASQAASHSSSQPNSFTSLVDFTNKCTYLRQQLKEKKQTTLNSESNNLNQVSLRFNVRRSSLFEDSFAQVHSLSPQQVCSFVACRAVLSLS